MAKSITAQLIMDAATKRGWQVRILNPEHNFYELTDKAKHTYFVRNVTTHKSSALARYLASQKDTFANLIVEKRLGTPPPSEIVTSDTQASAFLAEHHQVVVKPTDQAHGDGVTVNITTKEALADALKLARSLSSRVLIQKHIVGDDHRLLFIGGQFAAAVVREPASVNGDGVSTIAELINLENEKPDRGTGYQKKKTRIDYESAERYLREDLQQVPSAGEQVQVVGTANIGKGGLSVDVTDTVDPAIVEEARQLVEYFDIKLAGVDYLVDKDGKAFFIEINTAPSLGMHEHPVVGRPRQTPEAFLDWLAT